MDTEIKIPTLLGLGILLVGIVVGVLLVIQNQTLNTKASSSNFPKNIALTNITANSATISWQTDNPITGFIQAGPQAGLGLTFKDERDGDQPAPHQLHYVTIGNLTPSTIFYYKITSGSNSYPETAQTFVTSPELPSQTFSPLIGTVLDVNNQPAQEALVMLNIDGAQPLSAIIKSSGNFIIPLTNIYASDLSKSFPLDKTASQITVTSGDKISHGTVALPYSEVSLPPITLGKDFTITPQTPPVQPNKFDLNNDGQVNTADLSVIISNKGSNPKNPLADLNGDKVVDQKDLDLLSKEIERVSKK